jgi:hypothetical protein
VHVLAVGDEVTVYPVTCAPPSVAGADHDTLATVFPDTALGVRGCVGVVDGTSDEEGVDVGPVPRRFSALTLKVYEVPFFSPATVHVSVPVVEQVLPDGAAVTTYLDIEAPPVVAGVHVTVAEVSAVVTIGVPGFPGRVDGVAALDAVDGGPVPLVFCATTTKV